MKEVVLHLKNEEDKRWRVFAEGDKGANGACYRYRISMQTPGTLEVGANLDIKFQNGSIQDKGVNGISEEALLSVVADRLQDLINKHECMYRMNAMTKISDAITYLKSRPDDPEPRSYTAEEVAALLNAQAKKAI